MDLLEEGLAQLWQICFVSEHQTRLQGICQRDLATHARDLDTSNSAQQKQWWRQQAISYAMDRVTIHEKSRAVQMQRTQMTLSSSPW